MAGEERKEWIHLLSLLRSQHGLAHDCSTSGVGWILNDCHLRQQTLLHVPLPHFLTPPPLRTLLRRHSILHTDSGRAMAHDHPSSPEAGTRKDIGGGGAAILRALNSTV